MQDGLSGLILDLTGIIQVDALNSARSVRITISAAAEDARQIKHQISRILEMVFGPARISGLRLWGKARLGHGLFSTFRNVVLSL